MASSIGNSGMRKGLFFLVVYGHEVAEYADQYQWRYKELQKIIDFYAAKDMLFFTYFLIPCWFPWDIDFIHHNYKLNKIRIISRKTNFTLLKNKLINQNKTNLENYHDKIKLYLRNLDIKKLIY